MAWPNGSNTQPQDLQHKGCWFHIPQSSHNDCTKKSFHYKEENSQSPDHKHGALGPPGTGSQDFHVFLPLASEKLAGEGDGLPVPLFMLLHGMVTRAAWRMTRLSVSSWKILDQNSSLHRMVLNCPFKFWQLCMGLCVHQHVWAWAWARTLAERSHSKSSL